MDRYISSPKITYVKFKQPASRFAIVGCAVGIEMEDGVVKSARIGMTGVGESAYRAINVEKALVGQALTGESIDAATDGRLAVLYPQVVFFTQAQFREHIGVVGQQLQRFIIQRGKL